MVKRLALCACWLLCFARVARAQQNLVNVYGQMYLHGGGPLSESVRFFLTRDDGQINDYRYTDSNGRFVLERLSPFMGYTIIVDGDGVSFGDTTYPFRPFAGHVARVVVTLNPPPPSKVKPPVGTVSAASAYRPSHQVARLHEQGLQLVTSKPEDAERLFREAIEKDPRFFAPRNDLAALLMQERRYPEAEKVLRDALAVDPKSVYGQLNLGITLIRLSRYEEAIAPLRETLRLEPRLIAGHVHLGIALLEADQLEEAETELMREVKGAPGDQTLCQFHLGKLYARKGDFERSVRAFEAFLALAPSAPQALAVRELMVQLKARLSAKP